METPARMAWEENFPHKNRPIHIWGYPHRSNHFLVLWFVFKSMVERILSPKKSSPDRTNKTWKTQLCFSEKGSSHQVNNWSRNKRNGVWAFSSLIQGINYHFANHGKPQRPQTCPNPQSG